jgi:CBS-domain-containing membrane protein
MNDPVPYHIRAEDIDEVLTAYDAPADIREQAREHVMRSVMDIDAIVRTAPETSSNAPQLHRDVIPPEDEQPGDEAPDRRELALAAIEDLLIADGFLEPDVGEARIYPTPRRT